jgi:CRP/FNR family transcriptional regulator
MTEPKLIHFEPGAILFRPSDPCMGFVQVHAGTVRVSLIAENGREITLYRVKPGEVCLQTFSCLVESRPYSAEGVAESALDIEIIPVPDFQRRIVDDARFREQLFAAVAHRFADLEQLVEDVALTGFEARLARTLLRLKDDAGQVSATHEALAMETGSGRAVVSRQLGAFARDGYVSMTRGSIIVLRPDILESLAHPEL